MNAFSPFRAYQPWTHPPGSRRSTLMDLGPEKVTSTCPQSFAELDPDCLSRLLGAGKSFKLQRWRRGLLTEPDLASAPSANIAARVHSESERLKCTVPPTTRTCGMVILSVLWGHSSVDYCAFTASSVGVR